MPELSLPFWGHRKKVSAFRIVRLEGEGNYTMLYFCDGTRLMVSLTLKKLQSRLSPEIFVRLHKKSIVNLLYVKDIRTEKHVTVGLLNGEEIEVSRRKTSSFLRLLRACQLLIPYRAAASDLMAMN